MSRCIVLRGVRPQTRRVLITPGARSGVMVDGGPVTVFANRRQAQRAISRTAAAVLALRTAVVDVAERLKDSPSFASLFSPEPLSVIDVETLGASGVACELEQPRPSIDDAPATKAQRQEFDLWGESTPSAPVSEKSDKPRERVGSGRPPDALTAADGVDDELRDWATGMQERGHVLN